MHWKKGVEKISNEKGWLQWVGEWVGEWVRQAVPLHLAVERGGAWADESSKKKKKKKKTRSNKQGSDKRTHW